MNASEQATSINIASKIATVVNLMRSEFSDLSVDLSPCLSPWLNSAETRRFDDPNSIDLGFHFPGCSFTGQSRSILMQIRLPDVGETQVEGTQTVAVELSGHCHSGQQWHYATSGAEEFWGIALPLPQAQIQFKQICRQVVRLFDPDAKQRL